MSDPTNRAATPPSVTGRRRRFNGAHPYPALPRSRLPLLRGVLWIAWAAFLALIDAARALFRGRRKSLDRPDQSEPSTPVVARPPRMPSLTPTG